MPPSEDDRCGKRTMSKPKDPKTVTDSSVLKYLSVTEMADIVKQTMPFVQRVDKLTRNELCTMLGPYTHRITEMVTSNKKRKNDAGGFRLLRYDGANSCYIDSLLTALFLGAPVQKKGWVESVFLRMKKSPLMPKLQEIYTQMHMGGLGSEGNRRGRSSAFMATELRKTMQRVFPHGEWRRTQNDPNEVLELLDIPADMKVELTLRDKTKRQEKWPINTLPVEIDRLRAFEEKGRAFNVKRLFPKSKQSGTGIRVRVLATPSLYVPVFRAYWQSTNKEKKLYTPVIAPATLSFGGDEELKLRALIIHNGRSTSSGHYTAVLRLGGKGPWVLYDDMEAEVEVIGPSLADVWAWDDGYFSRNVAGIFYS